MTETCYILTSKDAAVFDVYSIRSAGIRNVLIFQEKEDAERYVIMMEEDETYIVGEDLNLSVTEVPLSKVLEVLGSKGFGYIHVKPDDLFIPPHWYADL